MTDHAHLSNNSNSAIERNQLNDSKPWTYPVVQGERPLFMARYILEGMSRDTAQGYHPYLSLDEGLSYACQVDMLLLAELYRDRKNSGAFFALNDLSDIFQKMPLLFTHEMVKKWEMQRIWAQDKYGLPEQVIAHYSQLLDSATPSDAYQTHDPKEAFLWRKWFEHSESSDILQVLDDSRKKWFDWEKQRHQHQQMSGIYHNASYLAKNLGLSLHQCHAWILLELVFHAYSDTGNNSAVTRHYLNASNNLWMSALKTMSFERILGIINKALHLPEKTIESLFYHDNILVKKHFLPDWHELDMSKIRHIDDLINAIHVTPLIKQILFTPVSHPQEILLNIAQPFSADTLPLDSWPDSQLDIQRAQFGLHQNKFPKVLIYGLGGSGKSTLVASLLDIPGSTRYGWIPDFEDSRHIFGDSKKNLNISINMNLFLLKSHRDNVLVFDGNTFFVENEDNKKIIKQILHEPELAQIWVIDNLDKIPADMVSNFDVVIYLGEMNQKKRLELSQSFFRDEDLSYRISQSTRTPGEIKKVANWCEMSCDYSWKNIFHFLASRDKLAYASKGGHSLLKEIPVEDSLVDMAGYPEMNELLHDLADYFNHPEYYRKLDAKVPKGILLTGEPGTGKTHFAKHLTRNIGVPLYMVDTSAMAHDISLIPIVFEQARQKAPCILFMDEIDSLINNPATMMGLDLEKQKVLNAFLSQLDGIHSSEGVLVIGATHRNFKPDPAAVRAGRLGQHIFLSLPHEQARKSIWQAHLKNRPVASTVDYDNLAQMSSSFSAAEIAEAINRACIQAAKHRSEKLEHHHLSVACDDIFWGNPDTNMVLSEEEKKTTAIHEAGHALIAMKNGFQVQRITVRPRKSALGAVQWQIKEGEWTFSRESLIARIELALGGIACEKAILGSFRNGGTSDLKHTREILHHMLMQAGLGETFGLSYNTEQDTHFWSEQRKAQLEAEEKEILHIAMNNCCQWLEANRQLVMALAHDLKTEREISGKQLLHWKEKVNLLAPCDIVPNDLPDWNQSGKPEHTTIHTDKN